jgi:hypothetical protein
MSQGCGAGRQAGRRVPGSPLGLHRARLGTCVSYPQKFSSPRRGALRGRWQTKASVAEESLALGTRADTSATAEVHRPVPTKTYWENPGLCWWAENEDNRDYGKLPEGGGEPADVRCRPKRLHATAATFISQCSVSVFPTPWGTPPPLNIDVNELPLPGSLCVLCQKQGHCLNEHPLHPSPVRGRVLVSSAPSPAWGLPSFLPSSNLPFHLGLF